MKTAILAVLLLPSLAWGQWYDSCSPTRWMILSRPDADRLHKLMYDERKRQFQKFAREAPIENLHKALATNPEKLVQQIAREEINRRLRLEAPSPVIEWLPLKKMVDKK